MLIAGGGVRYALAEAELAAFAERHNIPVAETVAGRGVLPHVHPLNVGPLGVIGAASANALAATADVVLAVGTRLQDFITGSWTVFQNPGFRLITLNAARADAHKHSALAVIGDAQAGLAELSADLGNWRAHDAWRRRAQDEYEAWNRTVDQLAGPTNATPPSYAQVVGAINRKAAETDMVVTAAGGLPGELTKNWRVKSVGTFDCEFGFSCMGYEIAGGWGIKMAHPDRDVIVLVGDGSYLMMNSDIYSTVLTGHKLIIVVCDNGGYAVINRLQTSKGSPPFNNLFEHCRTVRQVGVDFARHAQAMGALGERVVSIADLEQAFERAKDADRTYVIDIKVSASQWTPGDAWWDVGVPEASPHEAVRQASADHVEARKKQRIGG
ncbi:MAG TPA: thiamine pyrophosphate-dependent enzyme [Vineibacter terrae]|nr:thiamine pyrophosphate-dependent enzyme [Vineibacter terrae]HEX2886194.1 thiamine pyrophosphate-dependent enzyme [Vineibacter terrae]